jgi:hypothetical protein
MDGYFKIWEQNYLTIPQDVLLYVLTCSIYSRTLYRIMDLGPHYEFSMKTTTISSYLDQREFTLLKLFAVNVLSLLSLNVRSLSLEDLEVEH